MIDKNIKFTTYLIAPLLLFACQNASDQNNEKTPSNQSAKIPVVCKQSAQVQDIWKLEPILIKNGEITESMTKNEKETIIKSYIVRKNKQYEICVKESKGKNQ